MPCRRMPPRLRAVNATTSGCALPASRSSCPCLDRKSTRLNSSHGSISYAVFCLKKKKEKTAFEVEMLYLAGRVFLDRQMVDPSGFGLGDNLGATNGRALDVTT